MQAHHWPTLALAGAGCSGPQLYTLLRKEGTMTWSSEPEACRAETDGAAQGQQLLGPPILPVWGGLPPQACPTTVTGTQADDVTAPQGSR